MAIISTIRPSDDDEARIFPLPHSWQTGFIVSFEYLTDILTSANGKEQRRAVRNEPRLYAEGGVVFDAMAQVYYDAFQAGWQPRPTIAVMEHQAVKMIAGMGPNNMTAQIAGFESDDFYFPPGSTVVLSDGYRRETRTVSSCGASSITFSDTSPTGWPFGTRIMPAFTSRQGNTQTTQRYTSRAGDGRFKIEADPDADVFIPQVQEESDLVFLGERELFTKRLNWSAGIGLDAQWDRQPLDYGYGVIQQFIANDFPTRVMKMNYAAANLQGAYEIVGFFMRHFGRNREFLLPTWEDDIPYTALAGGGKAILIQGEAFAYAYKDSTVFRRIMVRYTDGTQSHHVVDYIEPLPDTNSSVLWVTDTLPAAQLTPENVQGISWVLNCRFAVDRLDVTFLTNGVSTFPLSFVSLENFEV